MLESLIRHQSVRNHFQLALLGALFVLVAAFFSVIVFEPFASVAVVFLTVIACIPYVDSLITSGESMLSKYRSDGEFLREYSHVIVGLLWLFKGMVVGFIILFFVVQAWFPAHEAALFSFQRSTLEAIAGASTAKSMANTGAAGNVVANVGSASAAAGSAAVVQPLTIIDLLKNNAFVFLLSLALAMCYTFGSITILAWNASVLGYAIAQWIVVNAGHSTALGALASGSIRYFLHGIPEIAAYVVVGMAGGVMSVAFANHDLWSPKWRIIMRDSLQLIIIAAALLVIGSMIEVYITPFFYT